MDDARLATEIASVEAQLDQIAASISELVDITVKSYSQDTGQTVTRAERHKLVDLIAVQDSLRNSLVTLQARQIGNGATLVIPFSGQW